MNNGTTRGKYIPFTWQNSGGKIKIQSEKMHHEYTHSEILRALDWLQTRFKTMPIPLANNVETLHNKTEKDGLGKALYFVKKDTKFAQGASYLGVVLEQLEIFEIVEPRPIQWKFTATFSDDPSSISEKLSTSK